VVGYGTVQFFALPACTFGGAANALAAFVDQHAKVPPGAGRWNGLRIARK
jgi:hypothetical protein